MILRIADDSLEEWC